MEQLRSRRSNIPPLSGNGKSTPAMRQHDLPQHQRIRPKAADKRQPITSAFPQSVARRPGEPDSAAAGMYYSVREGMTTNPEFSETYGDAIELAEDIRTYLAKLSDQCDPKLLPAATSPAPSHTTNKK